MSCEIVFHIMLNESVLKRHKRAEFFPMYRGLHQTLITARGIRKAAQHINFPGFGILFVDNWTGGQNI